MGLQIPNISAREQQITFAEFEAFLARPENQGQLFELIHGRIVEKVPTQAHGMTVVNIATEVKIFSRTRGIGRVGVAILHRLPTDEYNGRQPDLSFYLDTETPIVTHGAMPKMLDLAQKC